MNIRLIKEKVERNKGKNLKFRFNGSRNQTEEFSGVIENTYNSIFIIRICNNTEQIKSFSYNDVLTDSLEIFID